MFVFKHAFLNLRRHIWNYLLVGIMLFLLILGTMVTSTLYSSAKLFTQHYSNQFKTIVTILEPDLSNISHEKKLTKEQYVKFGKSKYVNGMKMIENTPISFETLTTIPSPSMVQFQESEGNELEENYNQDLANWLGAESDSLVKELAENGLDISAGSTVLKDNECLVSNEFAELNQLKIGDSIQVILTGNEKKARQSLVIAGMYQPNEQVQSDGASQLVGGQGNDIFTNWETLHAMEKDDQFVYNSVSYELTSMAIFEDFFDEIKTKGLPSEYQVMTNEANMKLLLSPVNGTGTLSGTILLSFLIFGNFGLALLSIRLFRQKQTEIYVLRNIGITKQQIIKSRLIELVVVASFSFTFALIATKFIVQPIADWQLSSQRQLMGNVDQLFSFVASEKNESIASIPMVFNANSFITFIGVTCLFLITIMSIDSYKVFKFEPIEFLLERNLDER
ncbi:ABC transporter permease [Enterococcus plantarum]|uniref:ABC transporter permease n=1 Tax=Enterococcus plantarum TaxID=1077675 RepID=A0A2W3Z4G4_9ENTE|nr:ABC transporter permease [Enterococcus plantarum]PZL74801.1 ABC transporter permease [Enterococcus plantarum]